MRQNTTPCRFEGAQEDKRSIQKPLAPLQKKDGFLLRPFKSQSDTIENTGHLFAHQMPMATNFIIRDSISPMNGNLIPPFAAHKHMTA
jgi:hypothetical protein